MISIVRKLLCSSKRKRGNWKIDMLMKAMSSSQLALFSTAAQYRIIFSLLSLFCFPITLKTEWKMLMQNDTSLNHSLQVLLFQYTSSPTAFPTLKFCELWIFLNIFQIHHGGCFSSLHCNHTELLGSWRSFLFRLI